MHMTLRRAEAGDVESLAQMRLLYLAEDFGELAPEELAALEKRLPGYFEEHLDGDLMAYVADEDGVVASCVLMLVVVKPASPAFPTGMTGTLLNVYTLPSFRRRGLAGALVGMAIEDAREMGLAYIDLKATRAGAGLYERLGFLPDAPRHQPMVLDLRGSAR
jgi:ribosomal protein S18 acetylase RimI-like enzyme